MSRRSEARRDTDVRLMGEDGLFGVGPGFVPNALVTCSVQAVTVLAALGLDVLGIPAETTVILFVLGVLVTAIFTNGPAYSLVASALSVLTFNLFIVEPRMSLQAWGRHYPATFIIMFAVALTASYLVDRMRKSSRASMEATIKAQNEQTRANLLRSVSHDLRTPLTSIIGSSDILLTEELNLDAGTRRRLLQDIHEDASWLADVVENLLSITRFDRGSVTLDLHAEMVDDVIEEALRHVRRDASTHQIVVLPSRELLLARMDAQVIVQVIVNLVNNALAHTPSGSTITLSSRQYGDDEVVITVADDGPGIEASDQNHVFEAFYTSKDTATDGRRGIGLGLALCKTIVEAHGGRIWVDPVDPHGTAFSFTLPLEEVPDRA